MVLSKRPIGASRALPGPTRPYVADDLRLRMNNEVVAIARAGADGAAVEVQRAQIPAGQAGIPKMKPADESRVAEAVEQYRDGGFHYQGTFDGGLTSQVYTPNLPPLEFVNISKLAVTRNLENLWSQTPNVSVEAQCARLRNLENPPVAAQGVDCSDAWDAVADGAAILVGIYTMAGEVFEDSPWCHRRCDRMRDDFANWCTRKESVLRFNAACNEALVNVLEYMPVNEALRTIVLGISGGGDLGSSLDGVWRDFLGEKAFASLRSTMYALAAYKWGLEDDSDLPLIPTVTGVQMLNRGARGPVRKYYYRAKHFTQAVYYGVKNAARSCVFEPVNHEEILEAQLKWGLAPQLHCQGSPELRFLHCVWRNQVCRLSNVTPKTLLAARKATSDAVMRVYSNPAHVTAWLDTFLDGTKVLSQDF